MGLDNLPSALQQPGADKVALIAGGVALVLPFAMALLRRRAKGSAASVQRGIKGGYTLKADTPLAEAIHFAATGAWDAPAGDPDRYMAEVQRAIDDFTQLAANDSIRVFYRNFSDAPFQILGRTSWHSHRVDPLDVLNGEALLRRRKDGSRVETAHDLRVSRDQWSVDWNYLRSTLH